MERLKTALEQLDETISDLEDRIGDVAVSRAESHKKLSDIMKQGRARETSIVAAAQKVALRLEQTIGRMEKVLKADEIKEEKGQ
ncbi:MAG: hypothetical protein FWF24_00285 [Alphaproteobacteria bacterium]|nr:hypothetical protein [Alphaproteobacteria bacterium]